MSETSVVGRRSVKGPSLPTWIASCVALVAVAAALLLHARYSRVLAGADPGASFEGMGIGAGWAILSILAWMVAATSAAVALTGWFSWIRRR